jgi:hypothetical protein
MRQKHVFHTSEIGHVWAQQKQQDGRNDGGNYFFEGKTIYSYGSHFPIATFADAKTVLFTTRTYSITTSSHISLTRQALRGLDVQVFHVPALDAESGRGTYPTDNRDAHKKNMDHYQATVTDLLEKAKKSRKYTEQLIGQAQGEYKEATAYHKWAKLRTKLFAFPTTETIGERITAQRKTAKLASIRRAELQKIQDEQDARELALAPELLEVWRNHGTEYKGEKFSTSRLFGLLRDQGDFLRIHKENGTRAIVETSRGVRVVVKTDKKILPVVADLFKLCLHCRTYQVCADDTTIAALPTIENLYSVRSIDEKGTVQIGCHRLAFSEIEYVWNAIQ